MHFAAEGIRTWIPEDDRYLLISLKCKEEKPGSPLVWTAAFLWKTSVVPASSEDQEGLSSITRSTLNSGRLWQRPSSPCALCSSCQGRCITLFMTIPYPQRPICTALNCAVLLEGLTPSFPFKAWCGRDQNDRSFMCELQSEQLSEVLFTELSSTMNRASLYLAPFVVFSKLPSSAEGHNSPSTAGKAEDGRVTYLRWQQVRNLLEIKVQRREWRSETAWMTCTTAVLGKVYKHADDECQKAGWPALTAPEAQTSLQQENK